MKAKILIVDEDPLFLEMIGDVLKAAGHTVTEASSPKEALSIIGNEKVQLVLCALKMTASNGRDLRTAANAVVPGLPFLFLTDLSLLEVEKEFGSLGTAVLRKPVDLRALKREIGLVLRNTAGKAGESLKRSK